MKIANQTGQKVVLRFGNENQEEPDFTLELEADETFKQTIAHDVMTIGLGESTTDPALKQLHDEKIFVAAEMELHGGSFVKTLAMMIYAADDINVQKIKDTWPEYWNLYLESANKKHGEE